MAGAQPHIMQNLVGMASILAYFFSTAQYTKPKSSAHCFAISSFEPSMAHKLISGLVKKHVLTEFWPDVELLDPNIASFVCKFMLVYLKVIEMYCSTLMKILCLEINTFNAKRGV